MDVVDTEACFTTQRKVFKFLVNDLEDQNATLINQLQLYQENMEQKMKCLLLEVQQLKEELENVNTENQQIHEMMVFFGNQINRNVSEISPSTSSVSENSSVLLEEIMIDLKKSTTINDNHISKDRVDDAVETIRKSIADVSPHPADPPSAVDVQLRHGDEDECVGDVVEILTDTIISRDTLIQNMVTEIENHEHYVNYLQMQVETYGSDNNLINMMRNDIKTLVENIRLKDDLLQHYEKRIYDQTKEIARLQQIDEPVNHEVF